MPATKPAPRMFDERGTPTRAARADGETYSERHDGARLRGQIADVFEVMKDGQWRTLDEIAHATGHPTTSVSTRVRDFRKPKFGGHTVERRPRGERSRGLFEYRLVIDDVET